ncbi:MAG TPA: hypothetical protein VM939_04905, partial [Gemmatimonadaceae bacterium]|nr:hypothetical protein [Gemmatimonadaceae bacterium]
GKQTSNRNDFLSDIACDSVMRTGTTNHWTHVHIDDTDPDRIIQYLSHVPGRCAQATILGNAMFANDRLLRLEEGTFASFKEITGGTERVVRVVPADGGLLTYTATINGRPASYDDAMRSWLNRVMPEVLKETSVDAAQRVARWEDRGGLRGVLLEIEHIVSTSARRSHYEALLDGRSLSAAEYDLVRRHVARHMEGGAADLDAVLTRLAGTPSKGLGEAIEKLSASREIMGRALQRQLAKTSSGADSVQVMSEYAKQTDDPEMILMALKAAKELSSDTDRRVLLQTVAARALGRKNPTLRKAFFDAATAMSSDTDLRVTLSTALPYGHSDPEVTLAVFKAVGQQMSSDWDKRVTLAIAVEKKLLKSPAIREAFMAAARTMTSDTDITALMQEALKQ